MSGGSFNYAYQKVYELDQWVATLKDMADHCRDWAASDRAETRRVNGVDVPTTLEDRAAILVRGMLLERAAEKLRMAIVEVRALENVMHDVEWVASGDYAVDGLMGPLKS